MARTRDRGEGAGRGARAQGGENTRGGERARMGLRGVGVEGARGPSARRGRGRAGGARARGGGERSSCARGDEGRTEQRAFFRARSASPARDGRPRRGLPGGLAFVSKSATVCAAAGRSLS